MDAHDDTDQPLRSPVSPTSKAIPPVRPAAEQDLLQAKEALERRTAELADSLSMLRATLESTADGILVTDAMGKASTFNEKFVQMWRIPREVIDTRDDQQLLAVACPQLKHPEQFLTRVKEIYISCPPETFDLLELADGRIFERYSKQQSNEGRNIGRVWNFRDITERTQGVITSRRLAAIVDSSDDAIVSKDLDSVVTSWNAGAERIFGYSAKEMIGQSILRVIPPERRAEERAILARIRDGQRVDHFETIRVAKGGRKLNVAVTVSPIKDSAGKVIGASKVARDITDRRQAEEKLRAAEERFQQLWETTNDAIVIMDSEQRIQYVNPAVMTTFGFSLEELISQGMAILMPERFREAHRRGLRRYLATGVRKLDWRSTEIVGLHKEGHEFPLEISFSHFRENDGDIFAAFIRDITERKLAQERLHAAKIAAEKASKAKDDFLAVLSHELRTPLTPALIAASYLAEHESLPPELREEVQVIHRNVQLEARLIDDLLDLTRITRGKLELHPEAVDAHHLLESALEIVHEDIVHKQLAVTTELAAHDHHVWADPVRIQQVFWNLINNAVKFTPNGGRISVRSSNESGRLVLQVTDDGIGIESAQLDQIFEAFEQGERTITRQFGGLGLGLTISKTLLDLHGGTISVQSDGKDQGASFKVTLAVLANPMIAPSRSSGERGSVKTLQLLLVEDHDDTRSILARLLQKQGYEVVTACSVDQALKHLNDRRFDVLISDIGLPGRSGYDLMREAKSSQSLKGIALSGFGMEKDKHLSSEAGFSYHLTKPINFDELQSRLREIAGCP
ncbi:MAG: PAS domain S-box protein [Verrucomicrobiales bacterium]